MNKYIAIFLITVSGLSLITSAGCGKSHAAKSVPAILPEVAVIELKTERTPVTVKLSGRTSAPPALNGITAFRQLKYWDRQLREKA